MEKGFLPISFYMENGSPKLRWCDFGNARFDRAFFSEDVEHHIFSQGARLINTSAHDIFNLETETVCLRPNGFIFHMSRCGSTLLANMLKQKSQTLVLSEPSLIVEILLHAKTDNLNYIVDLLRSAILMQGAVRNDEKYYVIKFYSAAVQALPLIQMAFPDVPKIFMYRDPVEVLVSNMDDPTQMWMHNEIMLGINHRKITEENSILMNCAIALKRKMEAFLPYATHENSLLNYEHISMEALVNVLDFFRITFTKDELPGMYGMKKFNAKKITDNFKDDSARKKKQASNSLQEIANEIVMPVFQKMEQHRFSKKNFHFSGTSDVIEKR